jgi:hypothetical protein
VWERRLVAWPSVRTGKAKVGTKIFCREKGGSEQTTRYGRCSLHRNVQKQSVRICSASVIRARAGRLIPSVGRAPTDQRTNRTGPHLRWSAKPKHGEFFCPKAFLSKPFSISVAQSAGPAPPPPPRRIPFFSDLTSTSEPFIQKERHQIGRRIGYGAACCLSHASPLISSDSFSSIITTLGESEGSRQSIIPFPLPVLVKPHLCYCIVACTGRHAIWLGTK